MLNPGTKIIWEASKASERSAKNRFKGISWVLSRYTNGSVFGSVGTTMIHPEGYPMESRWVSNKTLKLEIV